MIISGSGLYPELEYFISANDLFVIHSADLPTPCILFPEPAEHALSMGGSFVISPAEGFEGQKTPNHEKDYEH